MHWKLDMNELGVCILNLFEHICSLVQTQGGRKNPRHDVGSVSTRDDDDDDQSRFGPGGNHDKMYIY